MLMVVIMAILMAMIVVVIVLLGWRCVQLLVCSLVRRYFVFFCHFRGVQINAFQRDP